MVFSKDIRTDLALEINENIQKEDSKYSGIIVNEEVDKDTGIKVTVLEITNKHGEEILGREKGTYITIEALDIYSGDEDYLKRLIDIVGSHIKQMVIGNVKTNGSILVVGLGNRDITADSLGPDVVDKLMVNRHIESMRMESDSRGISISSICPGVMAQTGIETAQIVKGVVKESEPVAVIAIDALAARDSKRLNSTIQLSDRGINPGSGVGNHRVGITCDNIGVPVIAIGVPTVVDAPTIVYDALDTFIRALGTSPGFLEMADIYKTYTEEERYELARDVVSPAMSGMYVTSKDIDMDVDTISTVIASAINMLINSFKNVEA